MHQYSERESRFLRRRAGQFRGQVERYLGGELPEAQFQQLRLRNGLYLQRHAHMLRVAIPYGQLNGAQLRRLAHVAERYDKGYGHFTTRQNIQFNWPRLEDAPSILDELAQVGMHAIQTSGSCIRNITTDHLAGVARDEIEDPRPWCELLRQWSTLHPEFNWLPRKFKIAVTGAGNDRTALKFHDIGVQIVESGGRRGFNIWVGGGMGRTPVIARLLRENLPQDDLLAFLQAIIRVYNRHGRRDNKYRARIKILVNDMGIERFSREVNRVFDDCAEYAPRVSRDELERFRSAFPAPPPLAAGASATHVTPAAPAAYHNWLAHNLGEHATAGYTVVHLPLKAAGAAPGDMDAATMRGLAGIAEAFSRDEIRVTHDQNLVLPFVPTGDLFRVWRELDRLKLATPNLGKLTDMIACPGLDFCSLANARTIPLARELSARLGDLDRLYEIGDVQLKMSGCMNACGHHHAAHIGVLGVDKKGEEWYQLTLGGAATFDARIGERLGPAVPAARLVDAIDTLVETYVAQRRTGETFLQTVRRTGLEPFRKTLYADHQEPPHRSHPVAA